MVRKLEDVLAMRPHDAGGDNYHGNNSHGRIAQNGGPDGERDGRTRAPQRDKARGKRKDEKYGEKPKGNARVKPQRRAKSH